ncbi:unnamed protein product [Caretta caretta]
MEELAFGIFPKAVTLPSSTFGKGRGYAIYQLPPPFKTSNKYLRDQGYSVKLRIRGVQLLWQEAGLP